MKHTVFILYLVSFILLLANLYVYFNRNTYQYIKQSGYNELYQPFSGNGISEISITGKSAKLSLTGYKSETLWKIQIDSVVAGLQKAPIQFNLKEKTHQYTFISNDSSVKPIVLTIDYSSQKRYVADENPLETNCEIRYSSVPIISENNKWNFTYDYIPAEEINTSKTVLKNDAGINDNDADTVKFKKIARFIYKTLVPHIGVPPDSLLAMSPQNQFECIRKGNTEVWCSNFSLLLNYFCSISGLKIRKVNFTGYVNGISTGAHAVNEVYIPEYGGWVYSDLTQNLIFTNDDSGNYLNTADLLNLKSRPVPFGLNAYRVHADSLYYEKVSNPETLYGWNYSELFFSYPHDPSKLYSFKNKIKRYLTEDTWYEIYNNGFQYSNKKFNLKQFLFISFVAAFVLSMLNFALSKSKGK